MSKLAHSSDAMDDLPEHDEPLPTDEEQQAEYEHRKATYDERYAVWVAAGRIGSPPPRPVRPHIPGWLPNPAGRQDG